MGRKRKAPEKLHKWFRVVESAGKGRRRTTWNVTMDELRYGMSFEDMRREMDRIEAEHGDEFEAFRFEPQDEYDYGNEHPRRVYYVEGLRWETDEEYDARLAQAAEVEARNATCRRQQYEQLRKEFEEKG